jgi:predicted PurR-regulated permease PerM
MTLPSRNVVFWWLYVVVLAGAALFIAHSFLGILVLGLFGYYATRPIRTRFERAIESRRVAAGLTALIVLIPVVVLTLYAGIRMFQQVQRQFDDGAISTFVSQTIGLDVGEGGAASLLRNPPSIDRLMDLLFGSAVQQGLHALDLLLGVSLVLSLSVTLSYALLVYDDALSDAFAEIIGGRDATVYSYALAVDTDLESIFFGNLLFVLFMSGVATATYTLTNLVAPPGLHIPMAFTLGVLTGLTSLVPIVVGKAVYVPVLAYLAVTSARDGSGQFVFVGILLVVYVLVLDLLPQSIIQPYIAGRDLNAMILVFAYILGPILVGWYGFFFLPIVFVLMLEAVRIVLPELFQGESIAPEPELAEETGADAEEMREEDPDAGSSK